MKDSRRKYMKTRSSFYALALVASLAPMAAVADITDKTLSVPVGQQLNLETGAAVASGGDLKWDGQILTPQGGAAVTFFNIGDAAYVGATQAGLQQLKTAGALQPGAPLAIGALG